MFIQKKNRVAVYSLLFKEGTMVVKKDKYQLKFSDELNIPNLEVMALLKSFSSKGFVKETFNWQYYYYYLTNEGIEYLRAYLALPEEIVPATLKKAAVAAVPTGRPQTEKKGGPGGDFNPDFQGSGFGRGSRDGYRKEGGFEKTV
mmetsp:Transcript_34380/g.32778  ORF Transcript_34380/g.32778 Transcript_34380/m.32778 type:complete len:145 (+) Transcript_34380:127-561(+)|eukprot:CAMPEP_0119033030 /NCGR_PEP_ID=MMETSP1177-20130426/23_1 /TAXON_ID=2985 /ORGANISM="Ochromonas sp, Strain CCMP1899" /LENGTH=144 /DNA_ID=CAMNT_0006989461 /DNA_START=99 /DNA_END=533 /DNA_ORIENTATION=-